MNMQKNCKNCNQPFEVFERDQAFYASLNLAEPTWCPSCREQRRMCWRNEITLYPRKCDGTGEQILSVYSEDKKFPVYKIDYWYSDKWDPFDYGRDFDFNRPFFEQFEELMNAVPQLALSTTTLQNCDYVNQCGWCKDCYLIFEADYDEGCMYSSHIMKSKSCMDVLYSSNSELCYECVDCNGCYNLKFSQDCENCSESFFLKNCISCKNCFGCSNLKNKQYHIWNKAYSKSEYEVLIKGFMLKSRTALEQLKTQFKEYCVQFPQKNLHGVKNENSIGDYLNNTQNCYCCFNCSDAQDCSYVHASRRIKNVYDMTVFGAEKWNEFCCEVHEIGEGCRSIFYCDQLIGGCSDVYYSKLCLNGCNYLFGCVGLKHHSYCIFNKQYSKDEYEVLKAKIIEHMKKTGEWGEFFPAQISPYAYNETEANRFYPLTKEQALAHGYKWKDDVTKYVQSKIVPPDQIDAIDDSIIGKVLSCQTCDRNYKIISQELKFYKDYGLPVPVDCFFCRHQKRFEKRNPIRFWARQCDKCGVQIYTTYDPVRPEKVVCEACYAESLV